MKPCDCGRRGVHKLSGDQYECQHCHDLQKQRVKLDKTRKYAMLSKPAATRKPTVLYLEEHSMPSCFKQI